MRNMLNPRWIFILNTLPSILLMVVLWRDYSIVQSQLESHSTWAWLSASLLLLTVGNAAYAGYTIYAKKSVAAIYSIAVILSSIVYLYSFAYNSDDLIPRDIPSWMVSDSLLIYAGTFLMPSIMYALLVAIVRSNTWQEPFDKPGVSFLMAAMVPILSYIGFLLLLPLWKLVESDYHTHFIVVCGIVCVLAFLFFLLRTVYQLASKRSHKWTKYELVWKIPIALLFPIMGLSFNYMLPVSFFGDFSNYWFYILVLINGVALCLPRSGNQKYRLALFGLKCTTLTVTTYFFLVFLPYLPLSLLAVLLIGIGFLMLAPSLLFVLHVSDLSKDLTFLRGFYSATRLKILGICCFLIIPSIITGVYIHHRNTLTTALDYLYSPDYDVEYGDIDTASLHTTLSVLKENKSASRDMFAGRRTPYLTSYFNWLVLDNLGLSDSKIKRIEDVFDNNSEDQQPLVLPAPTTSTENEKKVAISRLNISSQYRTDQGTWVSQLDIELKNPNSTTAWGGDEYTTTFTLPTGCWISDYYLYVGDRKEPGILAEKKTAMWVYANIRNARKDPGILYYTAGNRVAFSVYPFAENEVRRTGIELIHKEPVRFSIDGHELLLGDSTTRETANRQTSTDNVQYISAKEKQGLHQVQRKPYYHFLIDRSYAASDKSEEFIRSIEQLMDRNIISSNNAQISWVNTYTSTLAMDEKWKANLRRQPCHGGFFLERAIAKALYNSYKSKSDTYPVLVVVTDNMNKAIVQNDFANMQFAFPESDRFYHLVPEERLMEHSLIVDPLSEIGEASIIKSNIVLAYPDAQHVQAYLRNDGQSSIVLGEDHFEINDQMIHGKEWYTGLLLQGTWMNHTLHPVEAKKEWNSLVGSSFKSHIMTPVTSYLVVENDAQKAVLLRKQQEVLSSNMHYDLGDEAQSMSEPSFLLVIALMGLWLGYRTYRNVKKGRQNP